MSKARPAIPAAVKREVRQRCGFGCVICGAPICEYDHMTEYSIVQEHEASNITMLCDSHHKAKTNELLAIEDVRDADANPFNRRSTVASDALYYGRHPVEFKIGGVEFGTSAGGSFRAIEIDGRTIFGWRIEQGRCLLTVDLFDTAGRQLLQIRDNELAFSLDRWDIEWQKNRLTIRSDSRKVALEVAFEVPRRLVVRRGTFAYRGVTITATPTELVLPGDGRLQNVSVRNAAVGLSVPSLCPRTLGRFDHPFWRDPAGGSLYR